MTLVEDSELIGALLSYLAIHSAELGAILSLLAVFFGGFLSEERNETRLRVLSNSAVAGVLLFFSLVKSQGPLSFAILAAILTRNNLYQTAFSTRGPRGNEEMNFFLNKLFYYHRVRSPNVAWIAWWGFYYASNAVALILPVLDPLLPVSFSPWLLSANVIFAIAFGIVRMSFLRGQHRRGFWDFFR